MLKVKINAENEKCMVEAKGSLPDLCTDVTILLNVMYEGLDKVLRKMFVDVFKLIANEEIYTMSPNQAVESKSKTEEECEELMKKIKDFLSK